MKFTDLNTYDPAIKQLQDYLNIRAMYNGAKLYWETDEKMGHLWLSPKC